MVTLLRTHERKFEKKKIRFVTALDLIKYLKQNKLKRFLLRCAPLSELPANILTMVEILNFAMHMYQFYRIKV